MKIYHGDIVDAVSAEELRVRENSYIAVNEEGRIEGIYPILPEKFTGLQVMDFGRGLIIPSFADLHVHASQYIQRGVGMDLLLNDWLNNYTFPQEAKFKDLEYAEPIYEAFTRDLLRHGTFAATVFTTIHRQAANVLVEKMEKGGLFGLVGKVNMDFASPDYLCETVEESLRETEAFLEENSANQRVKAILTPRFAPTCTKELLYGLGKLGKKYGVGLQTHLVESRWEAAESLRLFPDCASDAEIYEKAGLLGNGPAIFAHVIFPTEEDIRIIQKYDAVSVHCPDATNNIIAGIMPVKTLQRQGLRLAMGSDVGGGHGIPVYRQIAKAIQLSKLKEFYEPEEAYTIDIAQGFYMATKVGGSVFGKMGVFEKDYIFNALVLDGLEDLPHRMGPAQRLERFCYIGDDRNIKARFLAGVSI